MPKTIERKQGEERITMTSIKNGEVFVVPQGYKMNYLLVEVVNAPTEETYISLGKAPNTSEVLPPTLLPLASRRKNLGTFSRNVLSATGGYACRVTLSSSEAVINLYVSVIRGI